MTEPTKQIDFVVVLSRGGFLFVFLGGEWSERGSVCGVGGGEQDSTRAHTPGTSDPFLIM